MTQPLSQYFHRAPRYVLLPQDNCLIRLAGPKQVPWEEGTEIKNVSTTGLSFTAASDLSPCMGEMIRVEFTVPGAKQMACFAKVVRLENLDDKANLIAIEFELLSSPQKLNLNQGLKNKADHASETPLEVPTLPMSLRLILLISMGISLFCSAFLLFSLYRLLTQPNWVDIIYDIFKFW